jgi:hypothetical protein
LCPVHARLGAQVARPGDRDASEIDVPDAAARAP